MECVGGGVNIKGREEGGQGLADFAFSKGNNTLILEDGKHGGIGGKKNAGSHGSNCSHRSEWLQ